MGAEATVEGRGDERGERVLKGHPPRGWVRGCGGQPAGAGTGIQVRDATGQELGASLCLRKPGSQCLQRGTIGNLAPGGSQSKEEREWGVGGGIPGFHGDHTELLATLWRACD